MTINKVRKSPSWQLEQWIKKLKCSGSTGTEMESFPDIHVGVDPTPVEEHCLKNSVFLEDDEGSDQAILGKRCPFQAALAGMAD